MSYIGQRPVVGRYIKLDQISSGFNGSNTGFSMTAGSQAVFPGTARNLLLSLGGVIQEPDTDFTISGSTLTFTTPPVANTTFFGVIYGDMQATGTPSDGTVLPASIASSGHFKIPQLTVNEDGADVDFRVEGDTDANLLFIDASTDRVGIGTSSPSQLLHLKKTGANALLFVERDSGALGFLEAQASKVTLGSSNNHPVHIVQNSGDALMINSSKNVGIGTTGPTTKFHVLDTSKTSTTARDNTIARFLSNASNADCNIQLSNGVDHSAQLGIVGNGAEFYIAQDGTERLRIDSSGKVGIGTTNPAVNNKLHLRLTDASLANTSSASTLLVENNGDTWITIGSNASNYGGILFADSGSADIGQIRYLHTDNRMEFHTNSSERLRIDSSGNVGIGTTSPSFKLHVNGTSRFGSTRINSTTESTDGAFNDLVIGDYSSNRGISILSGATGQGAIGFAKSGTTADGYLAYVHNGTATSSAMTLKSQGHIKFNAGSSTKVYIEHDGKVGIGTSSPTALLHVDSDATTAGIRVTGDGNAFLELDADSSIAGTQIGFIDFKLAGTVEANIAVNESVSGNPLELNSATNHNITLATGGGNVGIGTTNGSAKLMVARDIADSTSNNFSNQTVILTGTIGGNSTDNRTGLYFAPFNSSNQYSPSAITCTAGSNYQSTLKFFVNVAGNGTGHLESYERMRINSNGYVSIGTTTNSYPLHVKGGVVDQTAAFDNTKTGDGDINYIGVTINGGTKGVALFGHTAHTTTGSQAAWMGLGGDDVAGGVGVKCFRGGAVQMNGTLRVNTSTQYGKLHVLEGAFNPNATTWLDEVSYVASGSFGGGYSLLDGSKGYSMYCHGSGNHFAIQHHSSTTATASGGVELLNAATSWTSASDEREKENLVTISDAITKIKTLRTVIGNYTWQPDIKHAFLIAQDVQAVLPEAVDIRNTYEETEKQRLGLRYTEVIPLLTAALQEAIAKIETLETKVAALEAA